MTLERMTTHLRTTLGGLLLLLLFSAIDKARCCQLAINSLFRMDMERDKHIEIDIMTSD